MMTTTTSGKVAMEEEPLPGGRRRCEDGWLSRAHFGALRCLVAARANPRLPLSAFALLPPHPWLRPLPPPPPPPRWACLNECSSQAKGDTAWRRPTRPLAITSLSASSTFIAHSDQVTTPSTVDVRSRQMCARLVMTW